MEVATGEVKKHSLCRRSTCLFCNRVRLSDFRRALALAGPRQSITLTGVAEDRHASGDQVKALLRCLRRSSRLDIHLAWAVEPNPNATGYHLHGWLRGDLVPDNALAVAVGRAGLGHITDLRPVTSHANLAYPVKHAGHNAASLKEHLRLNGAELLHARGFWVDSQTGEALTKEEALRRTRPRFSRSEPGHRWVAAPVGGMNNA